MMTIVIQGPGVRATKPRWATGLAACELVESGGTTWLVATVDPERVGAFLQRVPASFDVRSVWAQDQLERNENAELAAVGAKREAS